MRVSTPGREKKHFNARERESFNTREEERESNG
jgi:hypothetical protein